MPRDISLNVWFRFVVSKTAKNAFFFGRPFFNNLVSTRSVEALFLNHLPFKNENTFDSRFYMNLRQFKIVQVFFITAILILLEEY